MAWTIQMSSMSTAEASAQYAYLTYQLKPKVEFAQKISTNWETECNKREVFILFRSLKEKKNTVIISSFERNLVQCPHPRE